MNLEHELKRVADSYRDQGYQVIERPEAGDLPSFAKDFKVDIVGRRGADGVLVQVKQTREDVSADPNMSRYAEITSAQPRWRFDFVILQSENPIAREVRGAQEPSEENLVQALAAAEALVSEGYVNPSMISAWAGLEAAMRRKLRSVGESAGWGSPPRQLLNELYSSGTFSAEEFARLEQAVRLRNEIVHGFAPPKVDAGFVRFVIGVARRLLAESQPAKQIA